MIIGRTFTSYRIHRLCSFFCAVHCRISLGSKDTEHQRKLLARYPDCHATVLVCWNRRDPDSAVLTPDLQGMSLKLTAWDPKMRINILVGCTHRVTSIYFFWICLQPEDLKNCSVKSPYTDLVKSKERSSTRCASTSLWVVGLAYQSGKKYTDEACNKTPFSKIFSYSEACDISAL